MAMAPALFPHLPNPPGARWPSAPLPPPSRRPRRRRGRAAPLQQSQRAWPTDYSPPPTEPWPARDSAGPAQVDGRSATAAVAFPGRIDTIGACSPPSGTAPSCHCSWMKGYRPSPPSIRTSTGVRYPGLTPALPLAASGATGCPFPALFVRERRGEEEK
ncbi:hypothetical protein PAHAL_6G009200 [Panicum hallii]|jgi:hypothetical protein|uniref:Uncharacterized protein n=1 Tax=Panicum hallii TaxID=206008 RepID=A0A2T8IER9_9POAL|nr:hypothetical protein PAHAL_6G009200 [Panicum hallii]